MAAAGELMACKACARAKRKCSKRRPACQRCIDRAIECEYPPLKPSSFMLLEQSTTSLDDVMCDDGATDLVMSTAAVDRGGGMASLNLTISPRHRPNARDPLGWFLLPETWIIDHFEVKVVSSFGAGVLKGFAALIHRWFESWVQTGSNPFIHSHLYRARFPGCLQVAYTTLSSYTNRTDANTELILRILADRAEQLLADYGASMDNLDLEITSSAPAPLDTLEQLARVHALMIYQTICLFDGDIRSRHLAEGRIHVLDSWVTQLVECASRNLVPSSSSVTHDMIAGSLLGPIGVTCIKENLWHNWILAESVRRTWHMATGLRSVYFMLQQGWSPCLGGMMYTTRKGIWEAETASTWEKLCSEMDVGFLQRFQTEKLFTEATPEEIDDFGKMMLEITFGPERMKKWTQ